MFQFKLVLIEDTAWGCGAKFKNKFLGTWGDVGAFSFDFEKTLTTGEGGMLLFKSKRKFELAKAWHDHGHESNPKYPRKKKYNGKNIPVKNILLLKFINFSTILVKILVLQIYKKYLFLCLFDKNKVSYISVQFLPLNIVYKNLKWYSKFKKLYIIIKRLQL